MSVVAGSLQAMTTVNSIAVAMFTVADVDAARDYYTNTLGWNVITDVSWGEGAGADAGRWLEVAPPGSSAKLALNGPMGEAKPGGAAIGVETPDVEAELKSLTDKGVRVGELIGGMGPVPKMFSVTDPDDNWIWVVQAAQ